MESECIRIWTASNRQNEVRVVSIGSGACLNLFPSGDYLRTPRGKNITFYNLVASGENRIRCCLAEVPAPLLPTLVSAFVADGPQDVYLGLNLWLYDRCGSDAAAIRTLREMSLRPGAAEQVDTRSATCRSAYAQALAGYRRAGIMQ